MFSGKGPVHRRTKVKDVRLWAERFTFNLFRSDIIRCTLDPLLDRSNLAALTEVYNFNRTGLVNKDIIRLNITMDKPVLVHGGQTAGDHSKDEQHIAQAQSRAVLEVLAVEVLHGKQHLFYFKHAANFPQFVALSDANVVYLLGYFKFGLHLLEYS